jgi:integrase
MAARHEIQNLIRRGNVFYWRPRIPRNFNRTTGGHISLSLRQSDHMKARYMARRLNTLLHELRLRPEAALTTRDQLEALFRAEIERMGEHLDNLRFAARRVGSDPMLSVRADIEVGWAYRLIEMFGTMRKLNFEPDCPGRQMLERSGIPEHSIMVIGQTFVQEQEACRQAHFEHALLVDMKRHGIPDTLINRERATAQLMRAKADMLLDASSRYPEVEGQSVSTLLGSVDVNDGYLGDAAGRQRIEAATATSIGAISQPDVTDGKPAADATTSERPGGPESSIASLPTTANPNGAVPSGIPLPVPEFMDRCEKLIRSKRSWEDKTAQDVRVVVHMLVGILEEHGVEDSTQITQFHVGQLRDHFDEIPVRYGQSARMRKLSTRELREAAAKQMEMAKARGQKPPAIGLGASTIRKHLANIAEFLRYLRGRGYAVTELTMDGIRPSKNRSSDLRTLTDKPDANRLRPLFRLPTFTGCRGAEDQDSPGDQIFHSANYFMPMLLAYLGPRRNEIAGLAVKDVVETSNGWALDIRPNHLRRIKNTQSIRMLPVPDEVLRLKFVPYVQAIRDLGYQAVFPELFHPTRTNDPGDRFYKDFVPLVRASEELGDVLWKRVLHALRHGQADVLKQAGVSIEIIDDVSGRLSKGETSTRYTNAAGLPLIREILSKYPVVTDHLEPQPLQLLPWIAKRLPPPWANLSKEERLAQARSVRLQRADAERT